MSSRVPPERLNLIRSGPSTAIQSREGKSVPPAAKKLEAIPTVYAPAPTAGFILMDRAQQPITSNPEAVQILSYPEKPPGPASLRVFLADAIRSRLTNHFSPDDPSSFVTAFQSGRRQYFCRVFQLTSGVKGASDPSLALLLERGSSEMISMSEIAEQYRLSPRERQAVELLLNGLTTKEIAYRMKVSTNTVKAFMRVVMIKTGASTRSGLVAKIASSKSNGDLGRRSRNPNE